MSEERAIVEEHEEDTQELIKQMGIYEKLANIQASMKVPKNLYNAHGKYYYRNAETILETAKKACEQFRCTLTVHDEIKMIGDRYYVEAVATLISWDGGETEVRASAREAFERKGMDASQITGATSSYARKYALNGLFCLDDTKDADADEPRETQTADTASLAVELQTVKMQLNECGVDIHNEEFIRYVCDKANAKTTDPGKLILDPETGYRVLNVMKAIVATKKGAPNG